MRLDLGIIGVVALVAITACGYTATGPYGAGGGGGGGSNGAGGGPIGSVSVGDNGGIAFISGHNGTANPAVDTVAVGGTVTWTWSNPQGIAHSVQSIGTATFASSQIMNGNGQTYSVRFTAPGTYQYDCAVHGTQMTGRIVVR